MNRVSEEKTVLQLDDYLGLGKPGFNSPSAPGSLRAHAASLYLHPCLSHRGEGSRNWAALPWKKNSQARKEDSFFLLMKDNKEERKQIYPRANVT